MIPSSTYYDAVSLGYDKMLEDRANFLTAVERIIIDESSRSRVYCFLDIGSGNGVRSSRIIDEVKPTNSFLLDESKEMTLAARKFENENVKVIQGDFLTLEFKVPFQLITCLWNVFGHLESKLIRLAFLKKMHALLDEKGKLFIDINNRYNASHYGVKNVMKNMLKDLLKMHTAGTFQLPTKNGITPVYIHHPFELDALLQEAGFRCFKKIYINYSTGHQANNFLGGQIVYCIEKL